VNDELQRRINAHVLNGDAPSIIWAMERQIRINTELEAKLAELERREALLTEALMSAVELLRGIRTDAAIDRNEKALDALIADGFTTQEAQP
jgi:vacuolar-type H+-ATPase subunit E/Vma4